MKMLFFMPFLCAVLNLGFLMLPKAVPRALMGDFLQAMVSGVSIVLCGACMVVAMWRSGLHGR